MVTSAKPITAGEDVLVSAVVASTDPRKGTAKLAIGWGSNRSIITVPLRLVQRPVPQDLLEAASWAADLTRD